MSVIWPLSSDSELEEEEEEELPSEDLALRGAASSEEVLWLDELPDSDLEEELTLDDWLFGER